MLTRTPFLRLYEDASTSGVTPPATDPPDPDEVAASARAALLDERIAAAERAGHTQESIRLKRERAGWGQRST